MNETSRTLAYVGVAALSIVAAIATHRSSQPKLAEGEITVAKDFYSDFTDPNEAKGLRVVVFNEETATLQRFEVKATDGVWHIPSHHDYPADAKDRLAETATSVIGIKRGARQSRRPADHERFGVVDPLDESETTLKGRGNRITLFGEDGETPVVDYIIGKKVEGVESEQDLHYVRRADEDDVFRTRFKISLSAKFSDWIEADLLKIERDNLSTLDVVDDYAFQEKDGQLLLEEKKTSRLTRDKSSDPWKLDGLNGETEELKADKIRDAISALDDLKIVGVRRKPEGLRADLTVDSRAARNPLAMIAMRQDLESKGFQAVADVRDEVQLISKERELKAATNEGVVYSLYFGEIFTGSDIEIEAGLLKDKSDSEPNADAAAKDAKLESSSAAATDGVAEKTSDAKHESADKNKDAADEKASEKDTANTKSENDSGLNKSRYLFVRVDFDSQFLGAEPQKPAAPEKPEGIDAPADIEKKAEVKSEAKTDEKIEKKPTEAPDTPAKPETKPEANPAAKEADKTGNDSGTKDEEEQPSNDEQPAASTDEKPNDPDGDKKAESSAESPKKEGDAKAEENQPKSDEKPKSDSAQPDDAGAAKAAEKKSEEPAKPDPKAEYEVAQKKYEADLEKYNTDHKVYEDKVTKGREKAKELADRFAAWYYVISADSFEKLQLSRADIVGPKAKADDAKDLPTGEQSPAKEEPKTETPADETPKSDSEAKKTEGEKTDPDASKPGTSAETKKPAGTETPADSKPSPKPDTPETEKSDSQASASRTSSSSLRS